MNKLLASLLASAALLATAIPAAQAATTASNNFTVTVALTSQCKANNDSTQTVDFGTYEAFQVGAQASLADANIEFKCTRGFTPASAAFDTTNGTAIGGGVLLGLNYDLSVAASTLTTAGTAATSAPAGIGSGDIRTYAVSGAMPADQAGDCATASCAALSHTRTLIVTF